MAEVKVLHNLTYRHNRGTGERQHIDMNHNPLSHGPGVGRGRLEFKVMYNVQWERQVKVLVKEALI